MKVGVDFDDTIVDSTICIKTFFEGHFSFPLGKRTAYDFASMFPPDFISAQTDLDLGKIIWGENFSKVFRINKHYPLEGALQFLSDLQCLGHDICICSANPYPQYVEDWLQYWMPRGIRFTFKSGWDKQNFPIDVLLDDDWRFIDAIRGTSKTGILFDKDYTDTPPTDFLRAFNYTDALLILSLLESKYGESQRNLVRRR